MEINNKLESEMNELKELCYKMKELNSTIKTFETELKQKKEEFKKIAKSLDIDKFEDENVKVSITKIDKSMLDEIPTLKYLKENNLTQYIHTKEFFDYTELVMASTQNKIKIEDLACFVIKKEETRINIK